MTAALILYTIMQVIQPITTQCHFLHWLKLCRHQHCELEAQTHEVFLFLTVLILSSRKMHIEKSFLFFRHMEKFSHRFPATVYIKMLYLKIFFGKPNNRILDEQRPRDEVKNRHSNLSHCTNDWTHFI